MGRSLLTTLICVALWSIAPAPSIAAPPPPVDALVMLAPPTEAPTTPYTAADGAPATLADHKGKVVVLNFWATWCAPCVRELPSLDRLAGKLPKDRFAVLALSTDRAGRDRAAPFLKKLKAEHLGPALDSKSALARSLGLRGLPTTYVLDKTGRVIGKLEGVAEWDSEPFVAWLEAIADQ